MKYTFNPVTVVKIHSAYVEDDILDRLDGCEDYVDEEFGNKIYNVASIEDILNDPEDDTNETTRLRLSHFLEEVKTHDAEKILIVA